MIFICDHKSHYQDDWSNRHDLTVNLIDSIKNTEIDLISISHSLSGKFRNIGVNQVLLFKDNYEPVIYDVSNTFVNKFKKLSYSYTEILSRDEDVLTGDTSKSIYAVVCIHNNRYVGHIYAWLSNDKSTILAMGIRSRIDYCLVKERVTGVSKLLLEGVRLLGIHLNCGFISIAYPMGIMPIILRELGFTRVIINKNDDCDMGEKMSKSISIIPITGYRKTIGIQLDDRDLKFSVY